MESSEIVGIVGPILCKLCDYYIYEQNGYQLRYEEFSAEINSLLSEARQRAEKSETLKTQFRKIEVPLIFFIDYTVKESGFAFSRDYVPLAHSYNELSGDDKFFDLLDEAIKVEKDPGVLVLYYLMLGLGFDGSYKREPVEVIKRMQACAGLLGNETGKGYDAICTENSGHYSGEDSSWHSFRSLKILSVIALITALSFALNVLTMHVNTAPFRNSVMRALRMASPSKDYLNDTANLLFQAGHGDSAAGTSGSYTPDTDDLDDAGPEAGDDLKTPEHNPDTGWNGNPQNSGTAGSANSNSTAPADQADNRERK
ncbi:DotU family type IV/VI secretion system protein [Succinimonas amylolytica]|uniref:DotU family type IV/VI secretion system protein n=1 Tax=Succinimonas amylolytica TaxID=83769 RepID=UPI0023A81B53